MGAAPLDGGHGRHRGRRPARRNSGEGGALPRGGGGAHRGISRRAGGGRHQQPLPPNTMNDNDKRPIVTIALMAALADGAASPEEQGQLREAMNRLGITDSEGLTQAARTGHLDLDQVVKSLSDDAARAYAYELALVVCNAGGPANDREQAFLLKLRGALGLGTTAVAQLEHDAAALASASPATSASSGGGGAAGPDLEQMILQQAILAGAVELLPDRLANLVILPLQLRLVYQIGRSYGQQL
ncbi:MAG TPA: DUF533 domain-containing protein, partial [Gemmatimonadales bacterium]|nr:DUF533 domain-containing protein [Gemmatimonadales bacterium]